MKKIILFLCLVLLSSPTFASEAIKMKHSKSGVHVFQINTKKVGDKIKPLAVDELQSAGDVYNSGKYDFVLNGGFFDMKSGDEISYVIVDGVEVQNPFNNEKLISDLGKTGRLQGFLSRGELRILKDSRGKLKFEIAPHSAPIEKGYRIKHALQAGPQIAPDMDLVNESFIKYDENNKIVMDSISATKRRPRTLVAIKGKYLYAITFNANNKKTMKELKKYCKRHRLKQALALDGGGSTSAYFKDTKVVSQGENGRKVKSFLVVEK